MKIIHCADIHLDSKMSANLTKEKARERKTELLTTFQNMVTYGAEQGVAAIIIAGDLFDTKNVSATARNVVKDLIQGHPKIAFITYRGIMTKEALLPVFRNFRRIFIYLGTTGQAMNFQGRRIPPVRELRLLGWN